MTITVNWELTDRQVSALDAIIEKFNLEAKAAYDARVIVAAEKGFDPGSAPIAETRESFVTRLGLKSILGEIETLTNVLLTKNIETTAKAFAAATNSVKAAVLDSLNLELVNGIVRSKA